MLLTLSLDELDQIVQGLAMVPRSADLHRRLATKLHCESLLPIPDDTRRVWVRSFRIGEADVSCEYYDAVTCDRIEAAIEAVLRTKAENRSVAISATVTRSTSKTSRRKVG